MFFPQVITENKDHAAYIWIHLTPTADARACAKVVAKINKHVLTVLGDNKDDEYEEMWAGVGFGPEFYKKVRYFNGLCQSVHVL
jgi:hypothetical protein